MKTTLLVSLLLAATPAWSATLTLTPPDIAGAPGSTIGFGFSMTGDLIYYTSIVSVTVLNEDNPGLGSFVDWLSPQGGPDNAVLAPDATWTQSYDPFQNTGFGQYLMNAGVPAGSTDSGTFLVQYDQFFADPNTCSFCWVGDSTLTVDFSVTAAAPAPEPGSVGYCWIGAGALGLSALVQRWRRRRGSCGAS
jgi:hypothetical protein